MTSRALLLTIGLLSAGCSSDPVPEKAPRKVTRVEVPGSQYGPYPSHWWTPVPEAKGQSWEILPQAAKSGEVILSKRNELGILSNFAPTPFTFRGKRYASLEGFWQCMKYPEGPDDPRARGVTWKLTRAQVMQLTAFKAHAAGVAAEKHMKALGIDWVSFEGQRIRFKATDAGIEKHYALIVAATWAKVRQNKQVREVLMSTGDLVLKADHHEDPDGTKSWRYYDIYMEIRRQLRAGKAGPQTDK